MPEYTDAQVYAIRMLPRRFTRLGDDNVKAWAHRLRNFAASDVREAIDQVADHTAEPSQALLVEAARRAQHRREAAQEAAQRANMLRLGPGEGGREKVDEGASQARWIVFLFVRTQIKARGQTPSLAECRGMYEAFRDGTVEARTEAMRDVLDAFRTSHGRNPELCADDMRSGAELVQQLTRGGGQEAA